MMTNEKENVIDEITELREKFRDKWGKSVFDLPIPNILNHTPTLQQLLEILRSIVDTGESIQEGYIKYIIKRPLTLDDLINNDVNRSRVNRSNNYKNRRKKESKCL